MRNTFLPEKFDSNRLVLSRSHCDLFELNVSVYIRMDCNRFYRDLFIPDLFDSNLFDWNKSG